MELTRVNFPGYVKNREKAVQMIGGKNAIFNSIMSKDTPLRIEFRPNDQLGHGIQSVSTQDPCIVIRVKVVRHFKIENGRKKLLRTELIPEFLGKAIKKLSFDQPSDFQFLPPLQSPYNQQTTVDPPPQNFMYLPPPTFLHNYKYDNSYIQRRLFASQHERMKTWTKSQCPWVVNQNLLMTLDNGPAMSDPADDINKELYDLLVKMFSERPIWTALSIFDNLSNNRTFQELQLNESSTIFFHTLAYVAYYIKNGPFKMCWVRYGVNPIKTSAYSEYQSIVLSLKDWEFADEITKRIKRRYIPKVETVPPGISSLTSLPNRLFYGVQLCDLKDSFVKDLLKVVRNKYSLKSGWYEEEVIVSIRKFCLLKLQRMLNDQYTLHPDIIMADISSLSDLKKGIELARPAQKRIEFDFQLMNEFQTALGMYESSEITSKDDFKSIFTKKFSILSVCDRINSY
jgi:general transcription factor 3C polypeptide 5 (transcription factor C subunit 1)